MIDHEVIPVPYTTRIAFLPGSIAIYFVQTSQSFFALLLYLATVCCYIKAALFNKILE